MAEGGHAMAVDDAKLQQLLGKMLGEVGAAIGIGLVLLGDKFGLYKTLAAAGPQTSAELASRTGTAARARENGVADRITFQRASAEPLRPWVDRARPRNFPASSIWWHSSTACMTWATPSEWLHTSSRL
jgi:hypothetical protein